MAKDTAEVRLWRQGRCDVGCRVGTSGGIPRANLQHALHTGRPAAWAMSRVLRCGRWVPRRQEGAVLLLANSVS